MQEEDATDVKRFGCQDSGSCEGNYSKTMQVEGSHGRADSSLMLQPQRGRVRSYCWSRRYFRISHWGRMGHLRVFRAEEGASSLRPELAALEAALALVDVKEDLLLQVDCWMALTEIDKWIGERSKVCQLVCRQSKMWIS